MNPDPPVDQNNLHFNRGNLAEWRGFLCSLPASLALSTASSLPSGRPSGCPPISVPLPVLVCHQVSLSLLRIISP